MYNRPEKKDVGYSQSVSSKIWWKYTRKKVVKIETKMVDQERHQSVRIEKLHWKQKLYDKTDVKQMGRNKNQCLLKNCQKSAEWNGIYSQKRQTETNIFAWVTSCDLVTFASDVFAE